MAIDFEVFEGKSLSDIFKDIYDNSEKNKKQLEDIEIETRVNDEVRQNDRTSRMLFNIPKQINYISTFTTLMPGDIIITGTPTGAGARFDPPKFLKPGDRIEVSVEGIGTLINTVEDE